VTWAVAAPAKRRAESMVDMVLDLAGDSIVVYNPDGENLADYKAAYNNGIWASYVFILIALWRHFNGAVSRSERMLGLRYNFEFNKDPSYVQCSSPLATFDFRNCTVNLPTLVGYPNVASHVQ
jgi:hypothetical protein